VSPSGDKQTDVTELIEREEDEEGKENDEWWF